MNELRLGGLGATEDLPTPPVPLQSEASTTPTTPVPFEDASPQTTPTTPVPFEDATLQTTPTTPIPLDAGAAVLFF